MLQNINFGLLKWKDIISINVLRLELSFKSQQADEKHHHFVHHVFKRLWNGKVHVSMKQGTCATFFYIPSTIILLKLSVSKYKNMFSQHFPTEFSTSFLNVDTGEDLHTDTKIWCYLETMIKQKLFCCLIAAHLNHMSFLMTDN